MGNNSKLTADQIIERDFSIVFTRLNELQDRLAAQSRSLKSKQRLAWSTQYIENWDDLVDQIRQAKNDLTDLKLIYKLSHGSIGAEVKDYCDKCGCTEFLCGHNARE